MCLEDLGRGYRPLLPPEDLGIAASNPAQRFSQRVVISPAPLLVCGRHTAAL